MVYNCRYIHFSYITRMEAINVIERALTWNQNTDFCFSTAFQKLCDLDRFTSLGFTFFIWKVSNSLPPSQGHVGNQVHELSFVLIMKKLMLLVSCYSCTPFQLLYWSIPS